MKQVLFAPDVEEDLFQLIRILVKKHYLSTFDYAVSYVEDLVEYINEHIHTYPHKDVPEHFLRYGSDAKYISYNRSNHTTWYIIFEERQEAYFVTRITNNHVSGQYFNQ